MSRWKKVVQTDSPFLTNMTIDVKLGVARDTWARSPDANIEFYTQGPLTVLKNKDDEGVSLDGVVNTERGEYAFLGRRFVLSHGSAIFTGGQDLNPLLQLGAQYTIQPAGRPALNINIAINGTARKPVVLLSSDAQPPLSQSDLLSYLAFGQSSTSLLSSSGNSGVSGGGSGNGTLVGSAAALATRQLTATALGVMTRQFAATAARSLGADVFTITPADVPEQGLSLNGVQTVLAGTQIEAGKYVDRPDLHCDADPRADDTGFRRAAPALERLSDRGQHRLALSRQPADALLGRAGEDRGDLRRVLHPRMEVLGSRVSA